MAPEGFTFHGFLTGGKKERAAELQKLINSGRIFILYEAPHRLEKLIDELSESVPADRKITIARELTKKFEQIDSLYSPDLHEWLSRNPPKGEYVIVVDAASASAEETLKEEDKQWIDELIPLLPAGQLSTIASRISRFPKKIIYNYIVSKKNSLSTVD
jgi:16S rRNA (cytidine1402-2'-O)-methyltransferase